jgi:lipopolysaccharide export system permease protein
MRILDGYVTRLFIFALIFSVLGVWLTSLIVDLVEHIDTFIDKSASLFLVAKYYVFWSPYMIGLTIPVAVLLACIFSVGQLARHNELLAIKAAGISLYRTLLPLLILSVTVSFLTMVFGEMVIPAANKRKGEIRNYEIGRKSKETNVLRSNIFVQSEDGRIFHLKNYNIKTKTGNDVLVQKIVKNRLTEQIEAKSMRWKGNGWLFENGRERIFPDTLSQISGEEYRTFAESFRREMKVKPEAFAERQKNPEEMGYFELAKYVKIRKRAGAEVLKELTDLNSKISYPLINFIIVLFGAPIAANPRRSGMAVGVALTLLIAFCSYVIIKGALILGYNGTLSPALAAWSANILFAVLGTIFLIRARK